MRVDMLFISPKGLNSWLEDPHPLNGVIGLIGNSCGLWKPTPTTEPGGNFMFSRFLPLTNTP